MYNGIRFLVHIVYNSIIRLSKCKNLDVKLERMEKGVTDIGNTKRQEKILSVLRET